MLGKLDISQLTVAGSIHFSF